MNSKESNFRIETIIEDIEHILEDLILTQMTEQKRVIDRQLQERAVLNYEQEFQRLRVNQILLRYKNLATFKPHFKPMSINKTKQVTFATRINLDDIKQLKESNISTTQQQTPYLTRRQTKNKTFFKRFCCFFG